MERPSKTFLNRKKSLMKKASELSILCDAKVCMLIYDSGNNKPEIWPQNTDEVKNLIHNYKQAKENCGTRRSKKRSLDLTDVKVKDSDTNEASKKTRKSVAGSSSSTTVRDLWDGLNVDGLSTDQLFDLLSNLDRKIGGLQNRIDDFDHVAKKPYQYSPATPPPHMLDLLASSSSSSDDYSFQTTTAYPPGVFQNMMIQSQQDDQLDNSYYPPGYIQNLMIQSDQRLLGDQMMMMMSTSSSCQFSSFLSYIHQLRGGCCCSDQFSDLAAKLVTYKNIIPLLLESTYQL